MDISRSFFFYVIEPQKTTYQLSLSKKNVLVKGGWGVFKLSTDFFLHRKFPGRKPDIFRCISQKEIVFIFVRFNDEMLMKAQWVMRSSLCGLALCQFVFKGRTEQCGRSNLVICNILNSFIVQGTVASIQRKTQTVAAKSAENRLTNNMHRHKALAYVCPHTWTGHHSKFAS